jgi:two-component system chemotaxis response regulator CheY
MPVDETLPILIVDDYGAMRRIVRGLLRQLGLGHVDEAADAGTALRMLREKRYGLVISDWNMRPVSGLELLRRVRADKGLNRLPFIMVTAESKTESVIAAKEAGVSGYIVKPFTADTLRAKIAGVAGACRAAGDTSLPPLAPGRVDAGPAAGPG